MERNLFTCWLALLPVLLALATGIAKADLFVASHFSNQVLRYDDSGHFIEVLWNGTAPVGLTFGPDGGLYTSNIYTDHISRYNPNTHDFEPFTSGGTLGNPHQIAFGGPDNDLYVADLGLGPPSPKVNRFDGRTGVFKEAISLPTDHGNCGIAVDPAGAVYISVRVSGAIYKFVNGSVTPFAMAPPDIEGLAIGPDGNLYVGTGNTRILRFKPDGSPFGTTDDPNDPTFINDNRLSRTYTVTFGPDGNLYVASGYTNEILRYNPAGGFMDTFIPAGLGGLNHPSYLVFGRLRATLSGRVTLQSGFDQEQPLTFEFRPTDNSGTFQRIVTLNPNRTFSIGDLPHKNYTVWIKGAKWLARTLSADVTSHDITNVNLTLRAGDANNDNSIDVLDLDILIQTFDRCLGDAGYDERADFNTDYCTDVLDLDLLIRNFDRQGDP